jgi:hypothetical protein
MTPYTEHRLDRRPYYLDQEESFAAVAAVAVVVSLSALSYVLVVRFHFRPAQLVELSLYALCAIAAVCSVIWYSLTLRKRREENWPHPSLFITQSRDRSAVKSAFEDHLIKEHHYPGSLPHLGASRTAPPDADVDCRWQGGQRIPGRTSPRD